MQTQDVRQGFRQGIREDIRQNTRQDTKLMVDLVDASTHLRNLRHRLSLVPCTADPVPVYNPVQPRVDDNRYGAELTRRRKSVLAPTAPNRFTSESYPLPAPYHQFVLGTNSRWIGRE